MDSGYNNAWPEPNEGNGFYTALDIIGVGRIQDWDGDGSEVVEIGAFEFGGVIRTMDFGCGYKIFE